MLIKECPKVFIVNKCCFCVPVRKGVLIFGYVNLILSLLAVPLLVFLLVEEIYSVRPYNGEGLHPMVHLPMALVYVGIDVIMNIILLIGAHKKKKILLKIYLYTGIIFQIFTFLMDFIYFDYREYIENSIYFFFLVLNIYLLFLVYNTIYKIDQNSEVQYVAHQDTSIS